MIEAVILDMDGLLIDSEPYWRQAEINIFSKVGISLTDAMCRETAGLRLDSVVNHWYQKHPWTGPLKKDIETDILLGVSDLVIKKGKPMPGVNHIFRFFQKKNLPLALASSSPMQLIQTILSRLKVRDHFKVICSAESEPLGKPHPGIFLSTAKKMGIDPVNCLVFEDSYVGAIAVKAARMQCVLVPPAEEFKKRRNVIADLVIPSLGDFGEQEFSELDGGI